MCKSPRLLLLLALAAAVSPVAGQRRGEAAWRTQTLFGSETPIRRPARVPPGVVRLALDSDPERVGDCVQSGVETEEEIGARLAGSLLHVNRDRLPDLVVQATGGCFAGAHATTFWVLARYVTRTGSGHDLLLAVPGDYLQVLPATTRGYRDIESGYATAAELYTTVWKFDGAAYRPGVCTIRNLKTGRARRGPCAPPE